MKTTHSIKGRAKKVIFYSESETYGGHEAMSLNHIKAGFSGDAQISFIFNEKNARFKLAIESIGLEELVTTFPLRFRHRKIPILSVLLNYKSIMSIVRRKDPDAIVILQGNPDSCFLGILLFKLNNLRIYSYIPLPQRLSYTGGRFSGIRDYFVEKIIFPMFDKVITISSTLEECLIDRGVPESIIDVVKNSVDITEVSHSRQNALRTTLGLRSKEKIILLPGRIYFKQKGQDGFVKELIGIKKLHNFRYVIAGDGPNFEDLKLLVRKYKSIESDILLLGWRNDIKELISISDIVVLPSRYEGVPLVMLEALSQGKIVLASRRDGMKDYLPGNWLFDIDTVGDFADTINSMDFELEMANARLMREQFILENDRLKLGKKFMDSVLS